ncbi:MAG TPA: hypothetical protein DET46_17880 [Comamonadaceae bacterium]|nr:hypothetical protein [Comamonadaceae bacterium]
MGIAAVGGAVDGRELGAVAPQGLDLARLRHVQALHDPPSAVAADAAFLIDQVVVLAARAIGQPAHQGFFDLRARRAVLQPQGVQKAFHGVGGALQVVGAHGR